MTTMARIDRIATEARSLQFGRALLTIAAFPFYASGWVVGAVVTISLWVLVAVKVGWQDARAA